METVKPRKAKLICFKLDLAENQQAINNDLKVSIHLHRKDYAKRIILILQKSWIRPNENICRDRSMIITTFLIRRNLRCL
jgi:hypothetical protein